MTRNLLCLSALLVVGLLVAGCDNKVKIGVVDATSIFSKGPINDKANAYLQSLSGGFEQKHAELQKKVDSASGDEKAAALEAMQTNFAEIQKQFEAEQDRVSGIINDTFTKALEKSRTKLGLDVILIKEAVLSFDQKIDVTDAVLQEMGTIPMEFAKPSQVESAAPVPPKADPVPESGQQSPPPAPEKPAQKK